MKVLSKLILALVISQLVLPWPLWSADRYVRTDGNDANSGLVDSPTGAWRTLIKAAATLVCGETAFVRATGLYTETSEVRFSKTTNCPSGQKIAIKNFPGEAPAITWTAAALSGGTARFSVRSATPGSVPVPDAWVEGLNIGPAYHCVKTEGSLRFTFTKNTCHDTRFSGILGSTSGGNYAMTVDGNTFKTIGQTNQDHALYVTGQNYKITNNVILEAAGYGVQMDGAMGSPAGMVNSNYGTFQGIIANNTIAYGKNAACFVAWTGSGTGITPGPVQNTTITNNICYENAQLAGAAQVISFVSCTGCTGMLTNNVWWGTGNTPPFSSSSTGSTPAGFTISPNTNAPPQFVNGPATIPASPDMHLSAGSPAIDTGTDLTGNIAAVDRDGVARVAPWERGAYEFASTADTTAPSIPAALSATPLSSSQMTVAWSASTDNVAVTAYRVERCAGAGCMNFAQVASQAGTVFVDAGLTSSVVYQYRVRAADAAGNLSGYSPTASASLAPLSPPTGVTVN